MLGPSVFKRISIKYHIQHFYIIFWNDLSLGYPSNQSQAHQVDFENCIIQNVKAGGDSSARGMIIGMIMTAAYGKEIIPSNWIDQMKYKV